MREGLVELTRNDPSLQILEDISSRPEDFRISISLHKSIISSVSVDSSYISLADVSPKYSHTSVCTLASLGPILVKNEFM